MSDRPDTRALARGVACGLAGTAAMTVAQTIYYQVSGAEPSTTPAEVAKRIIRGVLHREVSDARTPLLNNVMHWLYGTGWGVLHGVARREPGQGVAFGLSVWGASLIELPAMQLAPPIWETPLSAIAPDVGFHLVYGVATSRVLRALTRGED